MRGILLLVSVLFLFGCGMGGGTTDAANSYLKWRFNLAQTVTVAPLVPVNITIN